MPRKHPFGVIFAIALTLPLALAAQPFDFAQGRQGPAAGRPLAIEDYYRLQTVGNPQISPNGQWVAFTLSTRIEEDNSTRAETYVVSTTGSSEPRRVVHYGKDVSNP
ncbi:MAG: hypothetical protein HY654_06305, partial [Acidobacteria bacterium]|nr:hypothetical protein [Acidobacteriota bacterium]